MVSGSYKAIVTVPVNRHFISLQTGWSIPHGTSKAYTRWPLGGYGKPNRHEQHSAQGGEICQDNFFTLCSPQDKKEPIFYT